MRIADVQEFEDGLTGCWKTVAGRHPRTTRL